MSSEERESVEERKKEFLRAILARSVEVVCSQCVSESGRQPECSGLFNRRQMQHM